MMKYFKFIFSSVLLISFLYGSSQVEESDFEKYKKQSEADYQQYVDDEEKEYNEYLRQQQDFEKYIKEQEEQLKAYIEQGEKEWAEYLTDQIDWEKITMKPINPKIAKLEQNNKRTEPEINRNTETPENSISPNELNDNSQTTQPEYIKPQADVPLDSKKTNAQNENSLTTQPIAEKQKQETSKVENNQQTLITPAAEKPKPENPKVETIDKPNEITPSTTVSPESVFVPSIIPVPISKFRISSKFGLRMHPIYKKEIMHKGVDIASPKGTEIYAAADGEVIMSGTLNGYGNYILLKHGKEYRTAHGHLNKVDVKKGDIVKKGQLIGEVGSTGKSTGPHLHFEVIKNMIAVDPAIYFPK